MFIIGEIKNVTSSALARIRPVVEKHNAYLARPGMQNGSQPRTMSLQKRLQGRAT